MDIYNTTLLCDDCNKKTEKSFIIKEGFKIRAWQCPNCNKSWEHPQDMEEFKKFSNLKHKHFQVKLRMVGNSYTISIPREIIDYTEIRETGKLVNLSLDSPEKVTLFFSKITRKFY